MKRPEFHFTAQRGWINDPNGLVYENGEYHLYFQHNPDSLRWGNPHWGHAVSRDLLHWNELGDVLNPNGNDLCFSGSAIIDRENAAGFGKDALLGFYTSTERGECLVYSLDHGRTFTEYEHNPIVRHRGRDPKVFRYEPTGRWIMAVYDEVNFIAFFSSKNLRDWHFESRIHGFYECPELFELNKRWVLTAANGMYSVGSFDGHEFIPETRPKALFQGALYAGQSFSNLDRRVMMFWFRNSGCLSRDEFYNQQISLPVELTLENDTVKVNPAVEILTARTIHSPNAPTIIRGIEFPPSDQLLVIEDSASLEVFRNGGEQYYAYSFPEEPIQQKR